VGQRVEAHLELGADALDPGGVGERGEHALLLSGDDLLVGCGGHPRPVIRLSHSLRE
jgi:hypothetical protein